jgi:ribosome-interacting GTPase 1
MQLLDLPGIIEGAKDGKGRGRQASSFLSGIWMISCPLVH